MREMKDSGIAWVGAMPWAWKMNTIAQIFLQVKCKNTGLQEKNLLSLSYGKVKRKSIDTVEGLLPESFDGYNIIEKDDIVLRLTDLQNDHTSLRVGLAEERGIITSAYLTIRNRSNFCPKYLYYYLHSFDIAKGFYGMGAGVRQGLNWDGVKWLKILAPSVPEQERIAAFLDAECAEIDAVLEKTRASIEEYKKLKQAVITQAVTKGIRGDRPMKDSGIEWIGDIPAEWEIKRIKNICSLKTGSTPSTGNAEWFNGDLLWFTPGDFNEKFVLLSSNRTLSRTAEKDGVATMIPANSVLVVCIGGSAGKVGYTNYGCSCNQQITALCKSNIMPKLLMYDVNAGMPFLRNTTMFTTLPILNNQAIGGLVLPIPREEEQLSIIEYLDEKCAGIDALIAKKQQYLTEIENYKKSLIYEYVTGKKEVV